MLKLTPLEQTRAGQELMALGEIKGLEKGRVEGLPVNDKALAKEETA